jgi:hypothetical protein
LESSGIGASLHRLIRISTRHLLCLGFLVLFQPSATSLAAQAPASDAAANLPDLPRFTLREIVAGHNDTLPRIPGRWLNAALAGMPESLAVKAYRHAASRSGIAPLEGAALTAERSRQVMGLYRRPELIDAIRTTLKDIRGGLSSDTSRTRFDHLFRSGDEWIVDIHDAALARARRRAPGTTWDSARRSLRGAHWLPAADTVPGGEAIPRALYGLTVLAANDSSAFRAVSSELRRADSASADAAVLLLESYAESQEWYVDALEFLLTVPWVSEGGRGLSLADHVRAYWRRGRNEPTESKAGVPEIRARLFGHPQAVPHYGVPPSLFDRLVRADNGTAQAWLERYGEARLLRILRWLPAGDTSLVLLETGSEAMRLTTVTRQSRESLNGFLEPGDGIAIDPGYSPLLALGAVVHEWQHLQFRRRQLEAFVAGLPSHRAAVVELPWADPYLAEGFAEWSTEQILAPLVERWPLVSFAELQKRAGLALTGEDDQHTVGYALVKALGTALQDRIATTDLLLRHAEQPSRIMSHRTVRRAWRRFRLTHPSEVTTPAQRFLIPEVTFTIEDGFPDVVTSRILIPPAGKRQ